MALKFVAIQFFDPNQFRLLLFVVSCTDQFKLILFLHTHSEYGHQRNAHGTRS